MLRVFLRSVDYFVLDVRRMWLFSLLRVDLKWSIFSLYSFRSCSMSEDELSEISLMNKIFKMLHKGITLNSVVPPAIMVGTILICSRMGWIMLGWLRGLHLGLLLDGAKDLVNRKLQWGEVSVHLENSELALRGVRVHQLVGVMPDYVFESCMKPQFHTWWSGLLHSLLSLPAVYTSGLEIECPSFW